MLWKGREGQERKGLLRSQVSKYNQEAEHMGGKSSWVWVGGTQETSLGTGPELQADSGQGHVQHSPGESEVLMDGVGLD